MTGPAAPRDEDEAERRRLGERLREVRRHLGLEQEEVAACLEIPRRALSDIENGRRRVGATGLSRLAGLTVRR